MFTGIVEEIGAVDRVVRSGGASLVIRCATVLGGIRLGDSIAVNGVCLTVAALGDGWFAADVQPVTRRRSNLGALRPGEPVNLERAVAVGGRLGGHDVQGHVDGVGLVVGAVGDSRSVVVRIAAPELLRYVVERGFVAVDGASLTVSGLRPDGFDVSLVETTQRAITLPCKRPGAPVNVEVDIVGKYVERLVGRASAGGLTLDLLRRTGFA